MKYTAVIRTLGTAGEKYQRELDSLMSQTLPPEEIIVYIAEGYPLPKETCGKERYVYVKKGMVAQRALPYDEVKTGWMLFLDDDLYLPPTSVETIYKAVEEHGADVVAPDIYPNAERPFKNEILMTLSGRMRARRGDKVWGYKVMNTGGYSYNKSPGVGTLLSQTNAGSCFFCRKQDFLKINFEDELWLDKNDYAIGDDQVMFYKMYLVGLKVMTQYGCEIAHLDAGNNLGNKEKRRILVSADYYFRVIFCDRFIIEPKSDFINRLWSKACLRYFLLFGQLVSMVKGDIMMLKLKRSAIKRAKEFLNSPEYKSLSKVL